MTQEEMRHIFGDDSHLIAMKLYGAEPWTDKVSPAQYELLLQKTHAKIRKNLGREKKARARMAKINLVYGALKNDSSQ